MASWHCHVTVTCELGGCCWLCCADVGGHYGTRFKAHSATCSTLRAASLSWQALVPNGAHLGASIPAASEAEASNGPLVSGQGPHARSPGARPAAPAPALHSGNSTGVCLAGTDRERDCDGGRGRHQTALMPPMTLAAYTLWPLAPGNL